MLIDVRSDAQLFSCILDELTPALATMKYLLENKN